MFERKWFDLKYIDVLTHHVDNMGEPNRRRMFKVAGSIPLEVIGFFS
jgi:hypothetical protein